MAVESVRNDVLNKILQNVDFTISNVWLSIHSGDPGTTGASEEESRQDISFASAAGGSSDSSNEVTFQISGTKTISHVGLWDAETGGTFLWRGVLDASKAVEDGDELVFEAGDVTVPTSGS